MRYLSYSEYLKNKYGEKVYKIPVNLDITCPNRDGSCGFGGCIFCGEEGAAFENLPPSLPVKEQIKQNIDFIGKKYKAEKYIIYFQNFTNTYLPFQTFKNMIEDSVYDNVCAVYISTRPDCVSEEYMQYLKEFSQRTGYDICIELGLQSVNYKTLLKINRGHTLAEFIDAVLTVKKYGFDICTHLILNLPWDDKTDVIEAAKFLSALEINQVKLHCLYILKDTPLAKMYETGEFSMGSHYEYIEKAVEFIRHLSPHIVIQRLIGRASEERSLFCNYGMSWWKIKDNIESQLEFLDANQGDKCDYLGGSALRKKYPLK
ncbi:MAG: TIGR01212 family radical SAM protein [Clostridia bacterium]|nr:TIGR01212 family radical SAM protein [Clostridia bacterium]